MQGATRGGMNRTTPHDLTNADGEQIWDIIAFPNRDGFGCGCGRSYYPGQNHCFCDYEYAVLGEPVTITLRDGGARGDYVEWVSAVDEHGFNAHIEFIVGVPSD